jgi:hypothetical protein
MSNVVVGTGGGQTQIPAGNKLISQVGRIVGGEDEDAIRAAAYDAINMSRSRLNRRDWRFTKTTASAITLVDGTATYSLPSSFKRPSYAGLIETTDSKKDRSLDYVDDGWFSHWQPRQNQTGTPGFYWLRNAAEDGLITVYPTPDTSAASDFTLSVEYYKRIDNINDDNTAIVLPEELWDVLVLGGQYEMLKGREKSNPTIIARLKLDFEQAIVDLKRYDLTITDSQSRFRIGSGVRFATGSGDFAVLIRP